MVCLLQGVIVLLNATKNEPFPNASMNDAMLIFIVFYKSPQSTIMMIVYNFVFIPLISSLWVN